MLALAVMWQWQMWVGSARIKFQNIWKPLKWSQCWVIGTTLHFFTSIFEFPCISFRLLFFSVLFVPSFVSNHLNNAIYLTHLKRVYKLEDTAAVWPDPSVDTVDAHVSLHICWELVLWTVPGSDALEPGSYQVCSTHCIWKQKAVCSRGNKWLAVTCQSELFVQVLVDFFSLGKFKCRLERGGELNTSAGVECYKLCLFVGGGLRCSLA